MSAWYIYVIGIKTSCLLRMSSTEWLIHKIKGSSHLQCNVIELIPIWWSRNSRNKSEHDNDNYLVSNNIWMCHLEYMDVVGSHSGAGSQREPVTGWKKSLIVRYNWVMELLQVSLTSDKTSCTVRVFDENTTITGPCAHNTVVFVFRDLSSTFKQLCAFSCQSFVYIDTRKTFVVFEIRLCSK